VAGRKGCGPERAGRPAAAPSLHGVPALTPAGPAPHRARRAQNKRNPRAPDFKHRTEDKALWISSRNTPSWVVPNLPPPRG
jgi:hypothetical protein